MKYIEDLATFNCIYEEHLAEMQIEQSYEQMMLEKYTLMEESLKKSRDLAMACFFGCTLAFFRHFTEEIEGLFENVLHKHKDPFLWETLKNRISEFHDENANKHLKKIEQSLRF